MRFGPREASPDGTLRLAFARDDHAGTAGVVVTPAGDHVRLEVHGDGDPDAVAAQAMRVLGLHVDASGWAALADADPDLRPAWRRRPGFRPVGFHGPWEAAAWAVLSLRRGRAQAVALRQGLAERLGDPYELGGVALHAFPPPDRVLAAGELGLPSTPADRLRGLAQAALAGALDAETIAAAEPQDARGGLLELPGIGPFWADLVLLRAAGRTDAPLGGVPRMELPDDVTERWRPWRAWAATLLRVDRA